VSSPLLDKGLALVCWEAESVFKRAKRRQGKQQGAKEAQAGFSDCMAVLLDRSLGAKKVSGLIQGPLHFRG